MLLSTLSSMYLMIAEPNADFSVFDILLCFLVTIFAIDFGCTLGKMIFGCFANNLVKIVEFILSYVFCIPFVFIEKYLITQLNEIKTNPDVVIWVILGWFGSISILGLFREVVSYLITKRNKKTAMKAEIEYYLINNQSQTVATIKSKTDGTIETSDFGEGTYNLHHTIINDVS